VDDVVDTASFSDSQKFYARFSDRPTAFWDDKERVQVLMKIYEKCECLWNVKGVEYKNGTKKKKAKEEIIKHFGLPGRLCLAKLTGARQRFFG